VLQAITSNTLTDDEISKAFERNFLLRCAFRFYGEWIAKAKEERGGGEGSGEPTMRMIDMDAPYIRQMYKALHQAVAGRTFWEENRILRVRTDMGRHWRVRISQSQGAQMTAEDLEWEENQEKWFRERSWYQFVWGDEYVRGDPRPSEEEMKVQARFWGELVEKWSDLEFVADCKSGNR
jgi:hypothetical protein